jgi:hypothetical protein
MSASRPIGTRDQEHDDGATSGPPTCRARLHQVVLLPRPQPGFQPFSTAGCDGHDCQRLRASLIRKRSQVRVLDRPLRRSPWKSAGFCGASIRGGVAGGRVLGAFGVHQDPGSAPGRHAPACVEEPATTPVEAHNSRLHGRRETLRTGTVRAFRDGEHERPLLVARRVVPRVPGRSGNAVSAVSLGHAWAVGNAPAHRPRLARAQLPDVPGITG